ncbi:TniQ family protein [Bosea sp. 47.2.35]|jgi:hypothetical protein|uniref:TniQ family protein n=1 Tax=Bosea sp. 47.2.35 TaxID=2969304 RepID=UPI0021500A68|nr:TniQ family protein [Bosea sp. 47.2.35]MCR4522149.1 TniQ family protein [Bosea sp. 47.2.35]
MATMRSPFPGRVKHHIDEPAYSLLLRTSLENGMVLIHKMFDMAGPREASSLSKLSPDEVARLCKADPVAVAFATPAVSPSRVDVLGETFSAEHFSINRRRWCPQCLGENGYHRVWWDITAVSSCPFHQVKLVSNCGCENRPVQWRHNPMLRCRRGHELHRVAAPAATAEALALDGYIVRRLLQIDQPASSFDGMAMSEFLALCERLGQVSKSRDFKLMQVRRSIRPGELCAEGFRILSNWPDAFQELLNRLNAESERRAGRQGVIKAYGEFYLWVRELPDHEIGLAMKGELRRHAEAHLTLKAGTDLGGAPVRFDTVTVEEGARRCGLGYVRFRDLLAKLEIQVRGEGQGARIDIRRDEFEHLEARVKGFKILKQVTTELGIDAVAVAELARGGHLKVIAEGTGGSDWLFPHSAASDFLAKLWTRAGASSPEPGRYVPLAAAAKSAEISLTQAVDAIFSGEVVSVRGGKEPALSAILADPAELASKKALDGVALSVAAEDLGLRQSVLDEALAAGVLKVAGPPGQQLVLHRALAEFKRKYVGIVELRPLLNVRNFQLAVERLAGAGIMPVVTGTRVSDYIYRRGAVVDLDRASQHTGTTPARGRNRKDIAKELFMEASMLRQLVEADLISMQPGCPYGSISDGEVARFKAAYATSSDLAKVFGIEGWKTIITQMEQNGVGAVCRPPQFDAFLFPRPEALRVMQSYVDANKPVALPDRGPSVTLKEAGAQLGMAYNMATDVARANILPNHYQGRAIMVTLADIEAFRKRYILGNELGALAGRDEHRGSGAAVTNRLLEHGLKPICRRPQFYSYLFERSAALEAMKRANLLPS